MRYYFTLFFCLTFVVSFSQKINQFASDTLQNENYDTLRIEIESDKIFPFCSNLYMLSKKDVENPLQPRFRYSTTLNKSSNITNYGFISSNDGRSFSWNYFSDLESAKFAFNDIPKQWNSQQKKIEKKLIKCWIMNVESEACMLELESLQGHKEYVLISYGTYNGYNFFVEYHSLKKIESNENIFEPVRSIIKIND